MRWQIECLLLSEPDSRTCLLLQITPYGLNAFSAAVAAGGHGRPPTHAARYQVVIGPDDRRRLEWPLYELLQPLDSRDAVRASPATASLRRELAVQSLRRCRHPALAA